MWKSGVESDGISSENDSREVLTVYEALNSACNFERFGCLARPDDEADKGSRASGMSSWDSRKAETFKTRRIEDG